MQKSASTTLPMQLILTIGGAAGFWATTVATSLLPIAAEYRAAFSNWSIQAVWVDSLLVGVIVGYCVSHFVLRFFEKAPGGDPILRSVLVSFIPLLIVTVLVDVPRSFLLPGPAQAFHYFFIGLLFNAARFLFLGWLIGCLYKRLSGPARNARLGLFPLQRR